jgi:hypothetical protein
MTTYRLYSSPVDIARALDGFVAARAGYTHVLGYSELGHGFLWNAETRHAAVLWPLQNGFRDYGAFDDPEAFRVAVLEDPGFAEAVLQPALVEEVRARVGELAAGEAYMPVPYPFLGGSGAPETYDKGDVLVFWSVVDRFLNGDGSGGDAA